MEVVTSCIIHEGIAQKLGKCSYIENKTAAPKGMHLHWVKWSKYEVFSGPQFPVFGLNKFPVFGRQPIPKWGSNKNGDCKLVDTTATCRAFET